MSVLKLQAKSRKDPNRESNLKEEPRLVEDVCRQCGAPVIRPETDSRTLCTKCTLTNQSEQE